MKTAVDFIAHLQKISSGTQMTKGINDKQADGSWKSTTYLEFLQTIRLISAGMAALGIKKGDNVALFSPSNSTWVAVNLAAMLIGAVSVPIYTTISNENFVRIAKVCEAKWIFIGGQEQLNFAKNHFDLFHQIVAIDKGPINQKVMSLADLIEKGEEALRVNPKMLDIEITPDDVATIVFSSGSTAAPKGVVLTHSGIFYVLEGNSKTLGEYSAEDKYLNFLPLPHIFGYTFNLLMLFCGIQIYYARDVNQLTKDCQEVHPTFIILVPRILEKIYSSLQKKIKDAAWGRRQLAQWAFDLAHKPQHGFFYPILQKPIADCVLYSKIRDLFGGKLKFVAIGSARSDPDLLYFFRGAGIPVLEGYGLTEACPVSINRREDLNIGTVGKPLVGIEVKIAEDGEILIRGVSVMKEYYKDPEATKAALDADGWFHTRDHGKLDEFGNIVFLSRFDDRTKTSYGIYVDVIKLETLLNRLPFVNFSLVVADDRPFASCLIFPNFEVIDNLKKQLNLENLPDDKLLNIAFMKKTVDQAMKELNEKLDKHEQINAYRFVWDRVDTSFLTQTMKMRRKFILEKYKNLISEMYPVKTIKL